MSHLLNTIKGSLNVVTGCGSGLGKATMQWFLKQGSGPMLAIDRSFDTDFEDSLDLTKEQRARLTLRKHSTYDESVESSLKEFVATHGPIDNLINVAGVAMAFTLVVAPTNPNKTKSYDLRHARELVNFNTVGTFNMIRLVSRYMMNVEDSKKKSLGRSKCIVNTSCISTSKPSVGQSAYAGTQGSIDALTLCVAREFSPLNIRCNTIKVGYFDTRLLRTTDLVCDYIEKEIVMCPKRLGHPDEFAHLAQAIVENQMLNGACIMLDGCTEPAHPQTHGARVRDYHQQ